MTKRLWENAHNTGLWNAVLSDFDCLKVFDDAHLVTNHYTIRTYFIAPLSVSLFSIPYCQCLPLKRDHSFGM